MEVNKMCELCKNTGWYGDNGPGIKGNREYIPCECRSIWREAMDNATRDLLWLIYVIRASRYLDYVRSITCSEYQKEIVHMEKNDEIINA